MQPLTYVKAVRGNDTRYFSLETWQGMGVGNYGWKEAAEIPDSVKALITPQDEQDHKHQEPAGGEDQPVSTQVSQEAVKEDTNEAPIETAASALSDTAADVSTPVKTLKEKQGQSESKTPVIVNPIKQTRKSSKRANPNK